MKILLIWVIGAATTLVAATPILVRPGIKDYADSFAVGVESFTAMLRENKMFVDNTLLIKECIQLNHSLYILGPAKIGKTVNLDMLKTFFERRVDEYGDAIVPKISTSNYRLFVHSEVRRENGSIERLETRLSISKYKKLCMDYLGEYPVVYVSFGDVRGNDIEEVRESMARAIRRAYIEHQYMVLILRNKAKFNETVFADTHTAQIDLESFENIISNEEDMSNMENRIKDLCRILSENFRQQVIVIFDDYDKPLTNILQLRSFPKEDLVEVARTMDRLTLCSFKTNTNKKWGFVAATMELSQYSWSPWTKYKRMDLLLDLSAPIARYFYFNQRTVDELFHKHQLTGDLTDRARKWYKGFQSYQYNLHSIANFLNSKQIAPYFNAQEFEQLAARMIATNTRIRRELLFLLSNRTFTTTYEQAQTTIAEAELQKLLPHVFVANASYGNETVSIFKLFLIRNGYLSVHLINRDDNSRDVEFGIPNTEISSLMCSWLTTYYQQKHNIDDDLLQRAANHLLRFVANQPSSTPPLERHFEELYNRSFTAGASSAAESPCNVEEPLHAVFTVVALKVQNLTEFAFDVFYPQFDELSERNRNYVVHDGVASQAIILQLNNDRPVDDTFRWIKKQEIDILEQLRHPKTVRLVVLKLWPNGTVNVYAKSNKFLTLDR